MASSKTAPASIETTPQELLQLICKYLARPDSKSSRLVSREFNHAAEVSLYRQIFLRRNMDSFCKFRMIASQPHLAKLVRALTYSGKMLHHGDGEITFNRWYEDMICQGLTPPNTIRDFEILRQQFTPRELQDCYQNFCRYYHSEELMQKFDTEGEDLIMLFDKLSQIQEVRFDSYDNPLTPMYPCSLDHFSSVGREMLVEPAHWSGDQYHVGQFTALLAAAHKNDRRLGTIKGLDLQWEVFQQSDEILAMMGASISHCEHLVLNVTWHRRIENEEAQVAWMISNALRLRVLELDFGWIPVCFGILPTQAMTKLSRLFVHRTHWPHLTALKLQGISGSEVDLKELLLAHATTLRSLELTHMRLEPHKFQGIVRHGSWVRLILFLHDSLDLENICFQGRFTNQWNETWLAGDATTTCAPSTLSLQHCDTFMYRIERYVVEGGDFPLPWPTETEGSSWQHTLIDFRPNLDESWEFCVLERYG